MPVLASHNFIINNMFKRFSDVTNKYQKCKNVRITSFSNSHGSSPKLGRYRRILKKHEQTWFVRRRNSIHIKSSKYVWNDVFIEYLGTPIQRKKFVATFKNKEINKEVKIDFEAYNEELALMLVQARERMFSILKFLKFKKEKD